MTFFELQEKVLESWNYSDRRGRRLCNRRLKRAKRIIATATVACARECLRGNGGWLPVAKFEHAVEGRVRQSLGPLFSWLFADSIHFLVQVLINAIDDLFAIPAYSENELRTDRLFAWAEKARKQL